MSQSLTLHYTPNQQDYASVLRLFHWHRTSTKVSLVFLIIAFGLVLFVILKKGSPLTVFEVIWLLFPPLFVIFSFYIQPLRIAKKAAQNEQLVTEATWILSDAGVQISSRYASTLFEWDTFNRLMTTREYYLMLSKSNKNAFRFVPRRAFTSHQEDELFLQLVSQNISTA
ncbi:MAG: hypothetical protein A2Y88_12925 [Chloroflexi bacterium RBG_13_48_10]|nr:MAG: hypothetical protein A2Y88_12925 [Chloroflexi bacterium RBG_13_48_10]